MKILFGRICRSVQDSMKKLLKQLFKCEHLSKHKHYLNGIKATSLVPDLIPRRLPMSAANLKVMAIKRKVKNVHIQDLGENSFVRFQNFDISGGYLVHQYQAS